MEIEDIDVELEVKFLESVLIMYALGRELSMNTIKQFMSKFWNFVKLPYMYYHKKGYFFTKIPLFQ